MQMLKKILYVEDESDIRQIAQIALEDIGEYELMSCESGQQALDVVASFKPDLILLDVMMPGMDGPATLGHLRAKAELADVPVVFMTAKVQPAEVEQLKTLGAIAVISKPFDPMTLAQQIQQIWDDR